MLKFDIPRRKYVKGKGKQVLVRMPGDLWQQLSSFADDRGWKLNQVILLVLDQYMQAIEAERVSSPNATSKEQREIDA